VAVDTRFNFNYLGFDRPSNLRPGISRLDAVWDGGELDRNAAGAGDFVLWFVDADGIDFAQSFRARSDAAIDRSAIGNVSSPQSRSTAKKYGETFLMAGFLDLLKDLWDFLRERKKYWLAPLIIGLVLLGALIVLSQGSAIAPFIYTLF
jgi:Family of unknown function (DUF5989)